MTDSVRMIDHEGFALCANDAKLGPWLIPHKLRRIRRCVKEKPDTKELFLKLAETWRDETWYISSIKKRTSHQAYLKMIGLGPEAVPLILAELADEPDYWFAALEAITREDPAPHAESLQELRDAWLLWGREHGYIA